MSTFEFVSHERYLDDPYISEAVCLCVDGKHRVVYVRKKAKNSGLFWDVIACSVVVDGNKKYLKSYMNESSFFRDDVMRFLEARSWEKRVYEQKNEKDERIPF